MMAETGKAVEVVFLYAQEDERLSSNLEKQLKPSVRGGSIFIWSKKDVGAGKERAREIEKHLNTANIILFLISPDFIASDDCTVEVKRAMERHQAGEARVIPVILYPTDWEETPFGKLQLQALPKNGKPVTRWSNRKEAFLDVAQGIKEAAQEVVMTLNNIIESSNRTQKTRAQLLDEGNAYYKAEKYSEALAAYEQIIGIDPDSGIICYYNKAKALWELGQKWEAFVTYLQAFKFDRSKLENKDLRALNDSVVYNKGLSFFTEEDRHEDLKEMLAASKQLIRSDSSNADAYVGRGFIFFSLGSWEEALADIEQAIQLDPNNIGAYVVKSLVLASLHHYEQALAFSEQAIRLSGNTFSEFTHLAGQNKGDCFDLLEKKKKLDNIATGNNSQKLLKEF